MKAIRTILIFAVLVFSLCIGASAMEHNMLKVGLKFGSDALESANLENNTGYGSGYYFGFYDAECSFVPLSSTQLKRITMSVADHYRLQLCEEFADFDSAAERASAFEGSFVGYINGAFRVRFGNYATMDDANAADAATEEKTDPVAPSNTGVVVTNSDTGEIIFYYDDNAGTFLGVEAIGDGNIKTRTWFKGYKYYGGFEYRRTAESNISVINVVNIEDYVKCVIPYEMSPSYQLEALKAQAICARTYAACQTKHKSNGFDVCTTTDCQVYYGTANCTDYSDSAVEQTAGMYLYYDGKIVREAVYYAYNGGASEDCKNVWGSEIAYLKGKADPYDLSVESTMKNYYWTMTYTASELSSRLASRGYDIGTVKQAYVSQFTPVGNVLEVTIIGTKKTITIAREKCRLALGTKSMRFDFVGTEAPVKLYADQGTTLSGTSGFYCIDGDGQTIQNTGELYVMTADGATKIEAQAAQSSDTFTIKGSGNGHNVGLSQIGANAMAKQGFTCEDILKFYYTGVTIEKEA